MQRKEEEFKLYWSTEGKEWVRQGYRHRLNLSRTDSLSWEREKRENREREKNSSAQDPQSLVAGWRFPLALFYVTFPFSLVLNLPSVPYDLCSVSRTDFNTEKNFLYPPLPVCSLILNPWCLIPFPPFDSTSVSCCIINYCADWRSLSFHSWKGLGLSCKKYHPMSYLFLWVKNI